MKRKRQTRESETVGLVESDDEFAKHERQTRSETVGLVGSDDEFAKCKGQSRKSCRDGLVEGDDESDGQSNVR